MPRPKYKQLYRQERIEAETQRNARIRLASRLREIQQVLTPVGEQITQTFDDKPTPISLSPHDYLCVGEFMHTIAHYGIDRSTDGYEYWTWRGRPIQHE